ncbi:MAG: aldehyde dehydrogenase family protein, partial [Planktomarina sp.]
MTTQIDVDNVNRVFQAQKAAQKAAPFPDMATRRRHLTQLHDLIADNKQALIDAITADFGCRSHTETTLAEIIGSFGAIHYQKKNLRRMMRPRRRHTDLWSWPAKNYVVAQPLGVVGIMSPWNYPLNLAVAPLASALAAGNRAMVVMSEETPNLYALFAKLIAKSFSEDHVSVFQGGAISPSFAALPFDHLLFTGSTRVGKLIALAAAKNLTPVTLELGGKSPAIVAPDYDVGEAANRITWAKLYNAGQTCIAPDYAFVPEGRQDAFVAAAIAKFNAGYQGLLDSDFTAIVSARFYERLNEMVAEAETKGAKIIRPQGCAPCITGEVHKIPLTLVLNPPQDCALMQEEIFGPILPIMTYQSMAEVVEYINNRDRPLSLYLYSHDTARRADIM